MIIEPLSLAPAAHLSIPTTYRYDFLSDILAVPFDIGLDFQLAAVIRLNSDVQPPLGPGFRSIVRIIQFPMPVDAPLMDLILQCVFGGQHQLFQSEMLTDDCFEFSVAFAAVASLITSFGDFRKLGILLRFPNRRPPSPPPLPAMAASLATSRGGAGA